MKVSGLTRTPSGKKFHVDMKTDFLHIAVDEKPINDMENLNIDPAWLKDDGEGNPPNYEFLAAMKEKYFESFDKILAKSGMIDQVTIRISKPAIENMWNIFLAVFRQDETYTERIGFAMNTIIRNEEKYRAGEDIFEIVVEEFFKIEKRQDRIYFYQSIVKWARKIKGSSKFFILSLQWICEYIYAHKYEWMEVVMDVKGMDMYAPKNWGGNPGGRSDLWLLIHNGRG